MMKIFILLALGKLIACCQNEEFERVFIGDSGIDKEFRANFTVSFKCNPNEMLVTGGFTQCSLDGPTIYKIPKCAKPLTQEQVSATINGTSIIISWNKPTVVSAIRLYHKFDTVAQAIDHYEFFDAASGQNKQMPYGSMTGMSVWDGSNKHSHTSWVIFITDGLPKLTKVEGKLVSKLCSNEQQCKERMDLTNVTIYSIDCDENPMSVLEVKPGLEFHKPGSIFEFKNNNKTYDNWKFDERSCNLVSCNDIDMYNSTVSIDPALADPKRAGAGTKLECKDERGNVAKLSCEAGIWKGNVVFSADTCKSG